MVEQSIKDLMELCEKKWETEKLEIKKTQEASKKDQEAIRVEIQSLKEVNDSMKAVNEVMKASNRIPQHVYECKVEQPRGELIRVLPKTPTEPPCQHQRQHQSTAESKLVTQSTALPSTNQLRWKRRNQRRRQTRTTNLQLM
jgi:NADH:ubiquinone oxidoreductase subunit D